MYKYFYNHIINLCDLSQTVVEYIKNNEDKIKQNSIRLWMLSIWLISNMIGKTF